MFDSSAVSKLRKNASQKALLEAIRKDESDQWEAHRFWHKLWTDGKGEFHRNVEMKERTGSMASCLKTIGDHLERGI